MHRWGPEESRRPTDARSYDLHALKASERVHILDFVMKEG